MEIETINPADGKVLQTYSLASKEQINAAIDSAHHCFLTWRKTTFAKRQALMLTMSELLRKKRNQLAELMANEMGKPVIAGRAEIDKCAWVCEHFAHEAENYLSPRTIKTEMQKTLVTYQPLGVVFAIMPWNFPFWQVFRFAAPTIMAGNTAILKHAPISTGTGNAIAALFLEAGFPKHLFQHLQLDNDLAAEVIANEKIIAVTLTGSERAGSAVASNGAKHLKKVVLELGGSDPYLVFADADLDLAAKCIVMSRLNNTGQVCIAAKRVIAEKEIEQELITKIKEQIKAYKMGDPLDPEINFGPMAREDLRHTLHQQVLDSQKLGASILSGGDIPAQKGFYYPPTILTDVAPGMPAFDEELFGPVIAITKAQDEEHAIRLANQTQYGLAAAIFSKDLARAEKIAIEEIEAGACFINAFVASDPRVPFGGIKRSGFGRELSREGILEFVNTKTIGIQ